MTVESQNSSKEVKRDNIDQETLASLIDLKKEIAEEVVDKMIKKNPESISVMFRKSAKDFLVDEWTFDDRVNDTFMSIISWLDFIPTEFQKYREMLASANSKKELESLKTKIFNDIDWVQEETSDAIRDINAPAKSTKGTGVKGEAKADETSESYEKDHLNIIASQEAKNLYDSLNWKEKPDLEPFACALKVYNTLKAQWKITNTKYMTVVDFTKKKWKHRFFVINMETNTVEHAVKVWHWKRTGWEWAKDFSNRVWSNKSSLWGYLLPDKITKSPKKSWSWLRQITGLESSNSNSAARWIAVHPGGSNLGSEWCFTLPRDISRKIMDKIKGTFLYAYAKDADYFAQSQYFSKESDWTITA